MAFQPYSTTYLQGNLELEFLWFFCLQSSIFNLYIILFHSFSYFHLIAYCDLPASRTLWNVYVTSRLAFLPPLIIFIQPKSDGNENTTMFQFIHLEINVQPIQSCWRKKEIVVGRYPPLHLACEWGAQSIHSPITLVACSPLPHPFVHTYGQPPWVTQAFSPPKKLKKLLSQNSSSVSLLKPLFWSAMR